MSSPTLSSDAVTTSRSASDGSGSGSSSAASSDVESDALNLLKCVLCRDIYTHPKVLSCFHTFCHECLTRVQESPDRILCPSCHTETYLSSAGLAGLMPDYAMINLVQEHTFDVMTVSCGGCKGRSSAGEGAVNGGASEPVVAHCYDCANYLCANCQQAHQYMHCFDGHQVVSLGDQYSGEKFKTCKTMKCTRHRAENLLFYCRTCHMPICRECTILEHSSGHETFYIAQIADYEVEDMKKLAWQASQKSVELRAASKNVEQSSVYLQQQYNKAKNSIDETFTFFCQVLEDRRQSLLRELDMAHNDKQVLLSSAVQEMQEFQLKVSRTCQFLHKLVEHSSNVETLVCKNMIENKLKVVIDYRPEVGGDCPNAYDIEFSSSRQNIQATVRNAFGIIRQSRNGPTVMRRSSVPNAMQNQILDNLTSVNNILQANLLSNMLQNNGISQSLGGFDAASLFNSGLSGTAASTLTGVSHWNGGTSDGNNSEAVGDVFSNAGMFMSTEPNNKKSSGGEITPPKSSLPRTKMVYSQKFGEFGSADGQFTEPSGVAVNVNGDILVADTNNHRIQVFDRNGDFRFHFGQCGKRDGQLLYPNRVAVCRLTGNIIVTERSPTHQVQIFTKDGAFVRKFGSNKLQHPRGVTVDNKGRIVIVECKVMRVIIFDQLGNELHKFSCSKHLEFPNGVVVNDRDEIFISDNRSHCVKVFSYNGVYLRQIGGEGITNYPIGVGLTAGGEILIADNHNNFNVTVFRQDGELTHALESRVKHAQCFDVALGEDGTIILASRDFRVYIYHYAGGASGNGMGLTGVTGMSPPLGLTGASGISPPPGLSGATGVTPPLTAASLASIPSFLFQQQLQHPELHSWMEAKLSI